LNTPSPLDMYNRNWIIHTRTEERPPAKIMRGAVVEDSLISNGCLIEPGAQVIRSVLSPGVQVMAGSIIKESILLTDTMIGKNCQLERAILDKMVCVGDNASIGEGQDNELYIPMIGKNAILPAGITVQPGATVGVDVAVQDFTSETVRAGMYIQTRRLPNEVY
jgi:glucose-1-phosphate adenylyltransferase